MTKWVVLLFLLGGFFSVLTQASEEKKQQNSPLTSNQIGTPKNKDTQKKSGQQNLQNKRLKNKQDNQDSIAVLPIRRQVISALNLSKNGSNLAKAKMLQLSLLNLSSPSQLAVSTEKSLNIAEQYLLFIAQAYQAKHKKNHKLVVKLLRNAELLNTKISIKQLNQPMFYQLHWLLAEGYASIGNFDQAYEHKKIYLRKYAKNDELQKEKLVLLLNKKYQTAQRNKENALLVDQNAQEQKKIKQIEHLQNQRERNTIFLVCVAIAFIVIIFRQYGVRRQLIRLARTDMLTQLMNRKTLFYLGERLYQKSKEQKSLLSVIYFDCDYFKKINDNYGHQVGDEVLKVLAKMGNDVMRSRDIFARIGGEEFVMILPDENLTKVKAVAEHLREKIAQYNFSLLGIKENLTASFGIASNEQMNDDFDQLLNAADIAMFKAKEQGRNKVVCFDTNFYTDKKLSIRSSHLST